MTDEKPEKGPPKVEQFSDEYDPENWVAYRRKLRREAAVNRRRFGEVYGPITKTLMGAMDEYHRMRSEGVSKDDAVKGLELVLREVMPMKGTPPRICEDCTGTGWELRHCRYGARCNRRLCGEAPPGEREHDYVVPCHCPLGDRFKRRSEPTDDTVVGKRPKRRVGGWRTIGR